MLESGSELLKDHSEFDIASGSATPRGAITSAALAAAAARLAASTYDDRGWRSRMGHAERRQAGARARRRATRSAGAADPAGHRGAGERAAARELLHHFLVRARSAAG